MQVRFLSPAQPRPMRRPSKFRKKDMDDKPTDAAILERAYSLIDEAMHTVALQRRRVRSTEPEDEEFVFRHWADLQFFVVALRRLRRAAELASNVAISKNNIKIAISKFDKDTPCLKVMRNVGEHIDTYALDDEKRHHKNISRRALQVGSWDGTTWEWLDMKLNVDDAFQFAAELHQVVRNELKNFPKNQK